MEVVRIKCPHCSAVLAVKKIPGIEHKRMPCPVCHEVSSFVEYQQVLDHGGETTRYSIENKRDTAEKMAILRTNGNEKYVIKPGKNVIGRKSPNSTADFQMEDASRRLSREHLVVEALSTASNGMRYSVSLCKEKVNPTYINDELLEYGDCVVLNDRDKLRLPNETVTFLLVDAEGTVF